MAPQFVDVTSEPNADAVAVQDGRVVKLGSSSKLGRYVVLQDVYGDVFTYAGLGFIAHSYEPPRSESAVSPSVQASSAPTQMGSGSSSPAPAGESTPTGSSKVRVFAHPYRNPDAQAAITRARTYGHTSVTNGRQPLRGGSVVTEGTVLGRVSMPSGARDGHLRFSIRPAGDASTIDPRAILSNWTQLDAALHPRGAKGNPNLLGATASDVFLLSKSRLEREVLSDPGIGLSACSRREVTSGAIDKRALAVLAFLSRSGLKPTVGTLRCGAYDASGYVVPGHAGDAVAIVAINGVPIAGHQGAGSITDTTIRTLLTLQGEFTPARIVSLMRYPGAPTTLARADHGDYVEVVFAPALAHLHAAQSAATIAAAHSAGAGKTAPAPVVIVGELSPAQWEQLVSRIAALPTPTVAVKPSSADSRSPGVHELAPGRVEQPQPGVGLTLRRVRLRRRTGQDVGSARGGTAWGSRRRTSCSWRASRSRRSAPCRAAPEGGGQIAAALGLGRPELRAGRVDAFGVEDRAAARGVRRRHVDAVFTHARGELRQRRQVGGIFQACSGSAREGSAAALLDRGFVLRARHAARQFGTDAAGAAAEKATRTAGRPLARGSFRQRDPVFLQAFAQRLEARRARSRGARARRAGGRSRGGRAGVCGRAARRAAAGRQPETGEQEDEQDRCRRRCASCGFASVAVDVRHGAPFLMIVLSDAHSAWRRLTVRKIVSLCRQSSRPHQPPLPNRDGSPLVLPVLPLLPEPAPEPPNSAARPPPLDPTLIDSALTAPLEPVAPVMVTVSPGWMPGTLALTVLVTLVPAEVVTLMVLPSELATYSVLPSMYATVPAVGRVRPALELDDPPVEVELAPARSAAKREARPAAAPEEEELEEEVWPFSMSTPPMNPHAASSTPSSARKMRFPPVPFPPVHSSRRRGRWGSSSGSSSHSSPSAVSVSATGSYAGGSYPGACWDWMVVS